MKLSSSDLLLMRRSILVICTSIAVSAIFLYSSGIYTEKTQRDFQNAQNMLNDARNRLTAAHEDQKNMDIYADEYGALIGRNVIGNDQRLDWIEGLEKLRRQNLVNDFRFDIAPQRVYVPKPPISSGNFDINFSEMKLQFDLLHETQLVNFFTALGRQIKGWYQLEECTLQRSGDENTATSTLRPSSGQASTHLKVECSGGWITLKNRNAQP